MHEDEESLTHIDHKLKQIEEELDPLDRQSDALAQQIEQLAVVDKEVGAVEILRLSLLLERSLQYNCVRSMSKSWRIS